MENENKSSQVETKKITTGLVLSWVFGIVLGIVGITSMSKNVITGFLFIISFVIVFPPTYNLIKNKFHTSLSRKQKIITVIVLLIVAMIFIPKENLTVKNNSTVGVPAVQNSEPAKVAIKVTATQLVEDYSANEVSADAKYKDNQTDITGVVNSIGKDIMDAPYIILKGDEYAVVNVQCMFSSNSEQELAKVSKGESITLEGTVSRKIMNVMVNDCKIVK